MSDEKILGGMVAALFLMFGYVTGRRAETGPPPRFANWHVISFSFWTIGVTTLLGVALFHSGSFYTQINDTFKADSGGSDLDRPSYVGLLAVLFGIPLAICGAVYAIYISQVSLAISRAQIDLTRRQLLQDHPFFEAFTKLWVLKARLDQVIYLTQSELGENRFQNIFDVKKAIEVRVESLLSDLNADETYSALIISGLPINTARGIGEFQEALKSAKTKTENLGKVTTDLKSKLMELATSLSKVQGFIPDRATLIKRLEENPNE